MIFLDETYDTFHINKMIKSILGQSLSIKKDKRFIAKGSNSFWLREYQLNDEKKENLDLKCNFEKFENGLILRISKNQKTSNILVAYKTLDLIELTKGTEKISPLWISPLRLLLTLKVPIRYARYFRLRLSEYSIAPLTLKIKDKNDYILLDSNGYNYDNTFNYFKMIKNFKTSA